MKDISGIGGSIIPYNLDSDLDNVLIVSGGNRYKSDK